ncbi:hypothetical protein FBZ90_101157 [Nitrospirillum pindoramense]|uniref:Uncharacterized protein n=2 Tax=Nitrospirillum amazonense TaxID=28077 RepID=A0A560HH87_9PROT|nr:hypothetical protein FBZ90_101157 [Nitrospirillum amazonense]
MAYILEAVQDSVSDKVLNQLKYDRDLLSLSQLAAALNFNKTNRWHQGLPGVCLEYLFFKAISDKDEVIYPEVQNFMDGVFNISGDISAVFLRINGRSSEKNKVEKDFERYFGTSPVIIDYNRVSHQFSTDILRSCYGRSRINPCPDCLSSLFKTDFFIGSKEDAKWVAFTVKSDFNDIEYGPGLGAAIFPLGTESLDYLLHHDVRYQIRLLPITVDGPFMYCFHEAYFTVQSVFVNALREESLINQPPSRREYIQYLRAKQNSLAKEVISELRGRGAASLYTRNIDKIISEDEDVKGLEVAHRPVTQIAGSPIFFNNEWLWKRLHTTSSHVWRRYSQQ